MRRCLRMLADAEAWHADDMRYLDHAATTPLRSAAREAWLRASETVGNPSSVHSGGRAARTILDDARESVAASLGCDPAEVLFTSGGTEADNLAILGTMRAAPSGGLAVSAVEHPAVLEAAEAWGRDGGATQVLPVDARGAVDVRPLAPATALVSVMWANNETGILSPLTEVAAAAREAGALIHSDAVAAAGHVPLSFREAGLDLLTVSAHKVGGPVGIGALVARRGLQLAPLTHGGGQERRLRSGTQDAAGAAAFATALAIAVAEQEDEAKRLAGLAAIVREALADIDGAILTAEGSPHLPGTVHAILPGAPSEALLFALDRAGLALSAGSACHAGVVQPSHVVEAMGYSEQDARATLRCSLGWSSTRQDAEALADALPRAVTSARASAHF